MNGNSLALRSMTSLNVAFMSNPCEVCIEMVLGSMFPLSSLRSGGCQGGSSGRGVSTRSLIVWSLCLMGPASHFWSQRASSSSNLCLKTAQEWVSSKGGFTLDVILHISLSHVLQKLMGAWKLNFGS